MLELSYPSELPLASIKVLLDKVRGGSVSIPECVQAGWILVGYGLGKGVPLNPYFGSESISKEDALLALLSQPQEEGAASGPLLTAALSVALQLALRLISEYIK